MEGFEPGIPTLIKGIGVSVYRLLGRNPSPMTGPGTNSYLIGQQRLCLLDPGPINSDQYDSFMSAIGNRKLEYILATHTHGDHSPGAARIHIATGAELVGLPAPEGIAQDKSFQPAREWKDGDEIDCGEYVVRLIHTPGHVSNHICYYLVDKGFLFTGDHVLEGTTSVILPPDGDMSAYLDSLRRLLDLELLFLAPGHGGIMDKPYEEINKLIAHRYMREEKVVARLKDLGECSIDELVLAVYDDVARHLIPWAKKTLLAHLIKLEGDKLVKNTKVGWKIA